jgi:hypothetical protein
MGAHEHQRSKRKVEHEMRELATRHGVLLTVRWLRRLVGGFGKKMMALELL